MASWKCVQYLMLSVCVYFAVGDTHFHDFDNTFVLSAAEKVIRLYCPGSNIIDGGGWVKSDESVLATVTSQANEIMKSVTGLCHGQYRNCTMHSKCPHISEVFSSFANGSQLTGQSFIQALPVALNSIIADNCSETLTPELEKIHAKSRPTLAQAWGYSIGFSSVVILVSNIGACLGPTMNKRFFRRLLQFLVAMGAGSLTSTSLLVLIPEAFDIIEIKEVEDYAWKASMTVMSIYFFFCLERLMKTCLTRRRKKFKRNISIIVEEPNGVGIEEAFSIPIDKAADESLAHSHGHSHEVDGARQTLAWMVLLGDVIHNFVDGLSIGAAFSEDVALGVSISLAVVSEELPHELADIAILLHSGMSMKKALFLNFLSACFCYLGLFLGVTLGNISAEASKWIFAMAGGLFLYVPLVDMLPDMSSQVDTLLRSDRGEAQNVVFLHALGLCVGAAIVIVIVNVSSYIVI